MPAISIDPQVTTHGPAAANFIRQIQAGKVARLIRFIVEPSDDGERVRTLVIGMPASDRLSRFPIVSAVEHRDDQAAMDYALRIFAAMKDAGLASSNDVAQWRRGLFAVVPTSSPT